MLRQLLNAAVNGDCRALSQLIDLGQDINLGDGEGRFTALMVASLFGNLDVVELLLKSGADINIKDHVGMVALDYAVNGSHYHVVERLVSEPGLDRATQDNQGHTILVNAVIERNIEIVGLLLKHGFDPNADCPTIVNPLRYALRKGDVAMADLLQKFGAR